MLEILASSGGTAAKLYPDSGPGPKILLNGSEDLGYFGTVAAADLFSLEELRKQTNFWVGADNNPQPTWVKMFLDKQVIYFPTQPLAVSVGWNALYQAGLVYGVDGPGVYPAASGPVNQLTYVTRNRDNFKVRLFKAQVNDPASLGGTTAINITADLKAGEWGRVILAIGSPKQSGYTGDNWALFPTNSFFLPTSSFAIAQNTRQADLTSSLGINNTQAGLIPKAVNGYVWLPVLEYSRTSPVWRSHDPVYGMTVTKTSPAIYQDPSYEGAVIRHRVISGSPITPVYTRVDPAGYEDTVYKIFAEDIKMQNYPILPVILNSVSYE